ncbi:MAG: pseudaminic acid synthase [Alteromonadaceae bacterium]|nr:pseudaminic acid synthase [Alteromonadaceae bacterium]
MKIFNRIISNDSKPFVIAEMSNNHLCDLSIAEKMIEVAANCGADAIKIQTYTADSLTIDCNKPDFIIKNPLWQGRSYYELYKEIAMPIEWTEQLFSVAKKHNIILFSSPFDEQSVKLLNSLDCPAYKVASFEIQDFALLKAIAQTGKPVILSSGISTFEDVKKSIQYLRENGSSEIAVLHCISSYPASFEQMNLSAITKLHELDVIVGLSDHSLSNIPAISSISLGGRIIEKHFILDRNLGGPDATFSIEPDELRSLVESCSNTFNAIGNPNILEQTSRPGKEHGRSIYIIKDVKAGEKLTPDNIRIIRPGFGLSPQYFQEILGKKSLTDISRGTALSWEHVK